MHKIAPETMAALSTPSEDAYLNRVLVKVRAHFPEHAQALGPDRMRHEARIMLHRARTYGVVSEHDVYLFICMGVALGEKFDTDPTIPWAGATLKSRILGDASERMDQAYRLALAALAQNGRPPVPLPDRHG